jgi:nucleoside-diphosphate-sugar epimerase
LPRVLITGSSGFVGHNLAPFLASEGHQLWSLDRSPPEAQRSLFHETYRWDELDRIPWNEFDAIVHLAGKAHDTRNAINEQAYYTINAGLTRELVVRIAAAAPLRPIKFLLFSSVKAAADTVDGELTEDFPPDPETPYGRSKLEAERIVATAAMDTPTAIVPFILRPCMIHGPGNKGNLNLLFNVVRKGIPWPLGAFDNRRSFVSIANVCAIVAAIITQDVPAGTYQLADDEPLSINRLIELIGKSVSRTPRLWRCPVGLVNAVARAGDFLKLPLNRERLRKLTESYVVSNRKIKAALDWDRLPVSAIDGISATLESFRSPAMSVAGRASTPRS